MEVLSILKSVCTALHKQDLVILLENGAYHANEELDCILNLLNQTLVEIATSYVYLISSEQIEVDADKFSLSSLKNKFYQVKKLKNKYGVNVKFVENEGYLHVPSGKYFLSYYFIPDKYEMADVVDVFPSRVVEDDVVLGVLSRYFLHFGFYQEYEVFENRFNQKMQALRGEKSEKNVSFRLWR